MNLDVILSRMRANAQVIAAFATDVSDVQARWRPTAASWSWLEVICHLYDEEREDFRTRVDLTLHQPNTPWPPIDPQGWVTSRAYNERDLSTVLRQWQDEREKSIAWLRSLVNPDWHISRLTPGGHTICAGDVMASWLAHDHLHIRQLNELQYLWHQRESAPFDVGYAGDW